MNTKVETMFDGAFVVDKDEAKWGLWQVVWRPLRHRWCLVLDRTKAMPWTAQELDAEPMLRAVIRPSQLVFASIPLAMDCAAKLQPPFMDVLEDSPFWTGPLGVRRRRGVGVDPVVLAGEGSGR